MGLQGSDEADDQVLKEVVLGLLTNSSCFTWYNATPSDGGLGGGGEGEGGGGGEGLGGGGEGLGGGGEKGLGGGGEGLGGGGGDGHASA